MKTGTSFARTAKKTREDFVTVLNQTKSEQVELERLYNEAERFAEKMQEKDRLSRKSAEAGETGSVIKGLRAGYRPENYSSAQ